MRLSPTTSSISSPFLTSRILCARALRAARKPMRNRAVPAPTPVRSGVANGPWATCCRGHVVTAACCGPVSGDSARRNAGLRCSAGGRPCRPATEGPLSRSCGRVAYGNMLVNMVIHAVWPQVVPGAGAPAPRSGGGDSESEDDAEAIRRANAKAIAQREHQQRVSSEHKAKAALEKQQAPTAKSAGAGKGAGKQPAPTAAGKSAKPAPKPAPCKGKASAPDAAGKSKQKRKGAKRPASEDDESGDSSDSDSGSDEEGIDMTRKAHILQSPLFSSSYRNYTRVLTFQNLNQGA